MYTSVLDDLFSLSREMNRIFDNAGVTGTGRWPESNLYEDKDSYIIVSKVPGMEKSDIDISLKDNTLTIAGERKKEKNENLKAHLSERFWGKFERNFLLNDKIDVEHIQAETENGLLIIKLPKSPETKPRKIEIK